MVNALLTEEGVQVIVVEGVEEVVSSTPIGRRTVSFLVHSLPKNQKMGLREKDSQVCTAFEAGRLKSFSDDWKKITNDQNDQNILDIVQHCHIEFIEREHPVRSQCYMNNFSYKEDWIIDQEIENLLEMKVIKEVEHHPNEFISPIFLVPKKNGEYRLILNLKELNTNIVYHHFKMETFESALKLVKPNCFFASVDIRHIWYLFIL